MDEDELRGSFGKPCVFSLERRHPESIGSRLQRAHHACCCNGMTSNDIATAVRVLKPFVSETSWSEFVQIDAAVGVHLDVDTRGVPLVSMTVRKALLAAIGLAQEKACLAGVCLVRHGATIGRMLRVLTRMRWEL